MSLQATLLERIQPMYEAGRFDKFEGRRSIYGALDLFDMDTRAANSILNSRLIELYKQSFGRKGNMVIPVIDSRAVTIGNTRSCTVAVDENNSTEYVLSETTYAWGFTMHKAQYKHNQVAYLEDFANKMNLYERELLRLLDLQCVTQLDTDKNIHHPANITAYYPVVGDALQVSNAEANDAYNQIATLKQEMDFGQENFNVLGSTSHRALISRLTNQGQQNDVNQAFQFGPFDYSYTNRIANGAGVASTAYVIEKGSLAITNRNTPDAMAAETTTDGTVFDEVSLPGVIMGGSNMMVGSRYRSTCADAVAELGQSFGGHSEASMKELFMFDTDVLTLTAYTSDRLNRFAPIQKFEFTTA